MLVYRALEGEFYMKKFKLDKQISTRLALLSMVGMISVTGLTGCKKKETKEVQEVQTTVSTMQLVLDDTNGKIDVLLPEVSDEIKDNATIMLLLDLFAKQDENGKISADSISKFKSKLDVDDMMSEFNSFLDIINSNAIMEGNLERVSTILPEELNNDQIILSKIESIVENIMNYSNANKEESVKTEYDKIYKLFVEEDEIEIDGVTFEIRDLTYTSRAVATTYAEVANYYARNYISQKRYDKLDERTNDQNNKAYIKQTLEILNNEIDEKSETDVITLFNNKYEEVSKLLNGKVNLSEESIKDLVNYINLEYLDSDKVSTKDKNTILGEYDDERVSNALLAIDAINTYNLNNQNSIIAYSTFLVDNYKVTESGMTDEMALNFVQYNTIQLNNTTTTTTTYQDLTRNPYFENTYKYFTKQDFVHGTESIEWQEISDGANFVNHYTILKSLNKVKKADNVDTYIEKAQTNLSESIQYIQNTIMGECKKVDIKEYIKTK